MDRTLLDLREKIDECMAEIVVAPLPDSRGEHGLMTQVYLNLISNALKFGKDVDVRVELTAVKENGQVVYGVRDNGIGVEPEYREQIFAPFKRLHGRAQYEGTGIGLAICRKAVEALGGRIWVESELGEGSHFRFTLGEEIQERDVGNTAESWSDVGLSRHSAGRG